MKRPGLQGLSLRARLLALGVTGVAMALALGSLILYAVLTFTLNRNLDDNAFATARTVAAMVSEDADPNAVEVYVGYLRRKVGRDVLLTVRGAGYRLGP